MTEDKICEFPYELIIGDTNKLTSDYLVKQFKNAIVTGALSSGCMLPNENTLCEKLGVGRSTLREAFKVLSVYGLIKRTKHGTYVNSVKDFNTSFLIDYNFEESDTKELMEFRIIFESETAFIAAQKATTEDIKELKKLIIKMEGCRDNISALSYYDAEFHSRIAYSTHNKLIMIIAHELNSSRITQYFFTDEKRAFQISECKIFISLEVYQLHILLTSTTTVSPLFLSIPFMMHSFGIAVLP